PRPFRHQEADRGARGHDPRILDRPRRADRRAAYRLSRRVAGGPSAARRSRAAPPGARRVTSASPERQLRALILAPRGRDAAVAQSLIELAGVRSAPCHDLPELVETLDDDVAFILMTEEAIRTADLKPLSLW